MSLLTEILKEIPLSTVLREKIATIEAANAALETENAILKDDLREARIELAKLQQHTHELTHNSELDETDIDLLKRVAAGGREGDPNLTEIAKGFEPGVGVAKHRIHRLVDLNYLHAWSLGMGDCYQLQPKAREYLIKNNLLT
jgi:hypothetical protein